MDKRRRGVDAYVINAKTFVMVCYSVNKVLKLGRSVGPEVSVQLWSQ